MPWPVKLGLRSHAVSQAFPLVDRVVLVPDAQTYIDELAKWSPRGRWPVLIEDDDYTPMFVRRFKPAQVFRRESVQRSGAEPLAPGPAPRGGRAAKPENTYQPLPSDLNAVIIRAFGGDPAQHSLREVFAAQNYTPPGVVIASLDDPAWTAAIALAAGRGQPLVWLASDIAALIVGQEELDQPTAQRLIAVIDALVEQQHYSFRNLGDDIDAITICRGLPVRAQRSNTAPNVGGPNAEGPVALTDLIGRNADGTRYAVTGWIFGSESQAAYMAMCSLFLQRERAWLFNTYPEQGQWNLYGLANPASALTRAGFNMQHTSGSQADDRAWLRSLMGGLSADIALVNTKGYHDFFDLSSGQAHPMDVPVLNEPLALHLIHSWALFAPARDAADTIGATWIRRGAYAAVGSCYEPYLAAFVPPAEVMTRTLNFVPFLVAARWWDGQQGAMSQPWRVVTIGDPLMLCAPPEQMAKDRIEPPPVAAEYGHDLVQEVKQLMRQAPQDASGEMFRESFEILNVLGRDEVAAGLWRIASTEPGSPTMRACARAALDPLFRRRDLDEFYRAWDTLPATQVDDRARDMLWHLLTSRLTAANSLNREALQRLEHAIRQPFPQHDVQRLAPALARAFGNERVLAMISREMKKTSASHVKNALAEIMANY